MADSERAGSAGATFTLLVVVVSWNVRELLARCLETILADLPAGFDTRVTVVDNASSDGSVEMVRRCFPGVAILAESVNRGYGGAANLALRASEAEYAVVLNPDTAITTGALGTLAQYLRDHPRVAVVGPRLEFGDGTLQPSRRRFPTLATALLESTVVQRYWQSNLVLDRYFVRDRDDATAQRVDWVVGACLALRLGAVRQVGYFDERYFMYAEEMDLCRRLASAGWETHYQPEARVTHHEGRSSSQDVPARHLHFNRGRVLYFRLHHGWLAGEFVRWFLLATYGFQFAEEAAKLALGHQRELRRGRLQLIRQVLRSGLRP